MQVKYISEWLALWKEGLHAVCFYKRYGFEIKISGEKYAGAERFQCVFEKD